MKAFGPAAESGYTLAEMVVVMAILGVVIGSIVLLLARGINADADQTRRFHAQQDARLALDKLRREIHAACAVSNPSTYNTAESSVTLYFPTDTCASGTHTVTWCTVGSGSRYALYRKAATSCTGATAKFADYLTSGTIFKYFPPNSYVDSSGTLQTAAGNSTLPRLHVTMTVNYKPTNSNDQFKVSDDIVFRNGPRSCVGAATC